MTINSMNVVNNLSKENVNDKKFIEDGVGTKNSIKFNDTFKKAINEKIEKYNKSIKKEEKVIEQDGDINEFISLEMIKYNIKPELKEENLGLELTGELSEEDMLMEVESSELVIIDEGILSSDGRGNLDEFEASLEKETVISKDYLEEDGEALKILDKEKNNKEKILNKEYNQPIENEEEKVKEIEVNKKFSKVVKNLDEESDIQRVGEDEEISAGDMNKLKDIDLKIAKSKIVVKNEDIKETQIETGKILTNENIHIPRTIPQIDSQIISEDNIHQFQKENIEIVANTIVKLMETTQEGDSNIMKVKLYPKELGNIDVLLTMNESKLEVKIMVQNQIIKDMFGENIEKLNQNLAKQNINLSEFSVDVNQEFNLGQGREKNQDRGRHLMRTAKMMGNGIEEEQFLKSRTITSSGGISILA